MCDLALRFGLEHAHALRIFANCVTDYPGSHRSTIPQTQAEEQRDEETRLTGDRLRTASATLDHEYWWFGGRRDGQ